MTVYDDTKWMVDAACRGSDCTLFFPGSDSDTSAEAIAICNQCKVKTQCRDYAVDDPTLRGIWGGTSTRERKAIRRAKRIERET